MKKIKHISLLLILFACANTTHAMLSRGVKAPQSLFSRVKNQFSVWKTQFVRWYSASKPFTYRTSFPNFKVAREKKEYVRTEDWINEDPFGQKIKSSLKRSQFINQGKRVYKVVGDIEKFDGFIEKGDFLVLDGFHKDHLEVFKIMVDGKVL